MGQGFRRKSQQIQNLAIQYFFGTEIAVLSKRFDRTDDGRRIHFASAMTLLGLTDGCDAKSGNVSACLF